MILIKLMSYKVGAGQYPTLRITRAKSEEWYSYFEAQINAYFEVAAEVP